MRLSAPGLTAWAACTKTTTLQTMRCQICVGAVKLTIRTIELRTAVTLGFASHTVLKIIRTTGTTCINSLTAVEGVALVQKRRISDIVNVNVKQ